MRPGSRSLKSLILKNGRIHTAEGKEFFAIEDHWIYWYDQQAEVKMAIPVSNVEYMHNETYRKENI